MTEAGLNYDEGAIERSSEPRDRTFLSLVLHGDSSLRPHHKAQRILRKSEIASLGSVDHME